MFVDLSFYFRFAFDASWILGILRVYGVGRVFKFGGVFAIDDHQFTVDFDIADVSHSFNSLHRIAYLDRVKYNSQTLLSICAHQLQRLVIPQYDMKLLMFNPAQVFIFLIIIFASNLACCYIYILSITEYNHLFFQTHSIINMELACFHTFWWVLEHIKSIIHSERCNFIRQGLQSAGIWVFLEFELVDRSPMRFDMIETIIRCDQCAKVECTIIKNHLFV